MRMSSATKKGDKGKSTNTSHPLNKENVTHSSNKISPTTKASESKTAETTSKPAEQLNPKVLPTAEQLRIAQMISDSKRDDPDLPEKVNKLVELTNCSADAAIIALHDSNNDLDSAIVALLDGETEGDWEVSGKKKKPKQQPQASAEGADTAHGTGSGSGRGRDRDRSRGGRGGPPRLRGRGRGRDNKENVDDGDAEAVNGSRGRGSRSGHRMSNGPGREGSRGGRGGRGGYRGRQRGHPQSADTWEDGNEYPALTNVEPWNNDFPSADDWDNEEYIGSLAETKVFTPSQSTSAAPAAAVPTEPAALPNGSTTGATSAEPVPPPPQNPTQVHYSSINNSAQQGIDLNALLQKTSGITVVSSALQQPFLQYGQPATDALKAAMGMAGSAAGPKSAKPLRPKIPSKIPSSAVEMPDDPVVSGLDVKFGTLDFGIEPSGFELGLDSTVSPATSASSAMSKQPDHNQSHAGKMEFTSAPAQPPAASSLPKPDSSLGGFSTSATSSAQQQSIGSGPTQAKATSAPSSYPYGTSYAPPGASTASSQAPTTQPAGAYPSSSQTSAGGVYSNSGSANSTYQGANSQTGYGAYGQQQSQQPQTTQAQPTQQQQQQASAQQPSTSTNYQAYNKISTSSGMTEGSSTVSNLRGDMPSTTASSTSRAPATTTTTAAANKQASATALATGSSGLPNMPPGVPMLGPGSFIMGQAPGLPYYAAAAAGIQQHPMYSLEEMQYRYPHLAAGYYDMGYQSPTSLGTGREGTLASLAYAGSDAKFSRNENNSPVPTSLSQNAAQSHGGAFITPAAAAAAPLTPAYAYYYSGGVMPGGYQFGAPALYPVSAAASGHAGSGATAQYGKGGPLGATATAAAPSAQTTAGATGAGPTTATASGYASYGSSYDDFKSVYNAVGSAAAQTAKIGGVGASTGPSAVNAAGSADLGVGPNVYNKTHNQLGKLNTYDKTGGFHTGTPPPYGLAGNANPAPLGVGVNVGPSAYAAAQHMFIPTMAPHQSQHSHLMHQQLHQDSNSGAGQRAQSGGQQNKQGSKTSYAGSYWGSN